MTTQNRIREGKKKGKRTKQKKSSNTYNGSGANHQRQW